jgi:hypothetical protein
MPKRNLFAAPAAGDLLIRTFIDADPEVGVPMMWMTSPTDGRDVKVFQFDPDTYPNSDDFDLSFFGKLLTFLRGMPTPSFELSFQGDAMTVTPEGGGSVFRYS